jgi:hypothetical protein
MPVPGEHGGGRPAPHAQSRGRPEGRPQIFESTRSAVGGILFVAWPAFRPATDLLCRLFGLFLVYRAFSADPNNIRERPPSRATAEEVGRRRVLVALGSPALARMPDPCAGAHSCPFSRSRPAWPRRPSRLTALPRMIQPPKRVRPQFQAFHTRRWFDPRRPPRLQRQPRCPLRRARVGASSRRSHALKTLPHRPRPNERPAHRDPPRPGPIPTPSSAVSRSPART